MIAVQFFIFLIVPLLFIGLINRTKAVWAGRRGAPLLQPFYDFFKLLRKGEIISKTTTFIFRLSPSLQLAAVFVAALVLPLPGGNALLHFPADFVLFTYALGLARFFMIIAALDTGSSFEGMGASREVTFATIVEPAFFILLGSLVLISGQNSFESIFASIDSSAGFSILVKILCTVSLFIMLLVEGSRVPVDDPNTHLELTMIHEVMVLDYSGPDLAFIQYASALKMVLIGTLLANIIIPYSLGTVLSLTLYLILLAVIAITIGFIESWIARLRMSHVPQFIFLMTALSLAAFVVIFFFMHGGF